MSDTAIKVENLSKIYRLGEIGTGSIGQDIDRWFKTKVMGKEDPFLKIGESNDRSKKGSSDIVYSLQNINFEINQGDAVGIIGRNGAGKSTLLKILSRVTTPTTGKINIKGRIASLLEVGTGFHPELTGRENIYLNGAILGMRKREIDRKFDEIIDFSGVERYIDTPVKRYSSGMYVRLAFAVAAHLESEILIVDEVLAVGDSEFQKKCLGKMNAVSKGEGRTILFVSHNLFAVKSLCKNAIFIKDGTIAAYGSSEKVISQYQIENTKNINSIITWENNSPKNNYCSIKSIYLNDANCQLDSAITVDSGIVVRIIYFVLKKDSRVGFTIVLRDANDNIVFSSINNHEKNYYSKPMCEAQYLTSCEIPPYFLNVGLYKISLIFFGPDFTDPIYLENLIIFEISDGNFVRADYRGDFEGVLRPLLNWETELLNIVKP
jgi:ABC-type polysaccharide/polyol phosphate transport system ATPase subunit